MPSEKVVVSAEEIDRIVPEKLARRGIGALDPYLAVQDQDRFGKPVKQRFADRARQGAFFIGRRGRGRGSQKWLIRHPFERDESSQRHQTP